MLVIRKPVSKSQRFYKRMREVWTTVVARLKVKSKLAKKEAEDKTRAEARDKARTAALNVKQTSPLLALPFEIQEMILNELANEDRQGRPRWEEGRVSGALWERSLQMTCRHFRNNARSKIADQRLQGPQYGLSCFRYAFVDLLADSPYLRKAPGPRETTLGRCLRRTRKTKWDDAYLHCWSYPGVRCEGQCGATWEYRVLLALLPDDVEWDRGRPTPIC